MIKSSEALPQDAKAEDSSGKAMLAADDADSTLAIEPATPEIASLYDQSEPAPESIAQAIEMASSFRGSPTVHEYLVSQGEAAVTPLLNAYFAAEFGAPHLEPTIIAMGPDLMQRPLQAMRDQAQAESNQIMLQNAYGAASGYGEGLSNLGPIRIQAMCTRLLEKLDAAHGESDRRLIGKLSHRHPVAALAYSPDSRWLVTASLDRLFIWDAAGELQRSWTPSSFSRISALDVSSDGKRLAVGLESRVLMLDFETGETLLEIDAHDDAIDSLSLDAAGKVLATGSRDHTLKLWDAATGELQHEIAVGEWVTAVEISPDGRIVIADSGNSASIWDAVDGSKTATYEVAENRPVAASYAGDVRSVAFSPDGRFALVGADHPTLWNVASNERAAALYLPNSSVTGVAFSPDGKLAATASTDMLARLYDLESMRETAVLRGHVAMLNAIAISPDGVHVASAAEDGAVRIWKVSRED